MEENLLDYQQAQQEVLARIAAGSTETVLLADASGRVLASDLLADWDLPRHDNSAMDGFAIRSEEAGAGRELSIIGTITAGAEERLEVVPGTAVRIMTGAIIPPGADAVVPVEKVVVDGEILRLQRKVEKGEHVRWQGEDLQKGALALAAGRKLSYLDIGLLATFGHDTISVFRRPKVAILATGNELVAPGRKPGQAQIFDCNTAALSAAISVAGGEPVPIGIARDNHASLQEEITKGLQVDLLVTAAGASVGEFDLVREVLAGLGAEEIFWGVAIKPGKPTGFCLHSGKPVFCLPGNPVSAQVTFELFVRPALNKMIGCTAVLPDTVRLPLFKPMKKKKARTMFARVKVVKGDNGLCVQSVGSQQTGMMTSMVNADGLAILPDGQADFPEGDYVEVILIR